MDDEARAKPHIAIFADFAVMASSAHCISASADQTDPCILHEAAKLISICMATEADSPDVLHHKFDLPSGCFFGEKVFGLDQRST